MTFHAVSDDRIPSVSIRCKNNVFPQHRQTFIGFLHLIINIFRIIMHKFVKGMWDKTRLQAAIHPLTHTDKPRVTANG